MRGPRVVSLDAQPFDHLPCLNALGRGQIERVDVPLLRARVDRLPDELDALVAAADLQALELPRPGHGPQRLLGEALADRLVELSDEGVLPALDRIGIFLAGDLYTVPDLAKRGGSGDVRPVWRAFSERFRWVAGVTGNHDEVGPRNRDLDRFGRSTPGVHFLDGEVLTLDGLRVGGVHGILGNPDRLNRQDPATFVRKLEDVLTAGAEIVVLHEGPDADGSKLRGSALLREVLEGAADVATPLVICGHTWWPTPLATLAGGLQVLKVDARVIVLERS